ncbi:hypothetical protein VPH35_075813 [Triticum aestivum]
MSNPGQSEWTSDSDDSDKFEWDNCGEPEPSSAPATRNFDVPGPSTVGSNEWINGEVPHASLIERFVVMGFPKEMVMKSIKEIGHGDADALLELLLTYKVFDYLSICEMRALDDDDAVGNNHSTSGCILPVVEDDDDLDFENWDGDDDAGGIESSSDDSDFMREMSERDEKIKSLVNMGFSEDEANRAIIRCGVDVDICVLVDSIGASQVAEDCHSRNLSDNRVTDRCFNSFGGRKKAILMEESRKKRKRYGGGGQGNRPSLDGSDEESMPLPNPMVGFNLPGYRGPSVTRMLSKLDIGPPFFYYENVARAPKGEWAKISRNLFDGKKLYETRSHINQPEFVDSLHLCAAARKRGCIHNLPIENRSPLLPLPPKTIFEAFPHYQNAKLTERIQRALVSSSNPPPKSVQKDVMDECKKWNLVWVGKNKVAPLEPHEMEFLLGFPKDHTRGVGKTQRYKSLGNSFQVDTVAYHLSVLRRMFPNGVRVLSLFTGIGGGEVALHKLGIHMRVVVSVEIGEANRRILRGWWDQTQTGTLFEIPNVKSLTDERVASFVSRFGGFDLVIGGSPCNNLAGSNRHHRDGLEGKHSALFYDYVRILNFVKSAMGTQFIVC